MKKPHDELKHARTAEEIKAAVKRMGWSIEHGTKHDLAVSPSGAKVPIPRHKGDLPKGTLYSIIKRILLLSGLLLALLYLVIESGLLH